MYALIPFPLLLLVGRIFALVITTAVRHHRSVDRGVQEGAEAIRVAQERGWA
jgi:Flp pilus assembly protein TadG